MTTTTAEAARARETAKDLIAKAASTVNVLRMLGHDIPDETLAIAEQTRDGRPLLAHLVAIGAIEEKAAEVVAFVSERIASAKSVDEVEPILVWVRRLAAERRMAAFDLIPPTDPGENGENA
jgi:hypothetical protein